jgi:23S rRNA pseudouridine1911/1915/1917 synthase
LILDKPAGIPVYSTKKKTEEFSVVKWALGRYPEMAKTGFSDRPGIVHRLDKQTSGLLLLAKTQKGFEFLQNLFRQRRIAKEYQALVWGVVAKHGIIDAKLTKIGQRGISKVRVDESGKEALTEYWTEAQLGLGLDRYALLRVKLHTGRTHQIRAHFASIRHPVMGDDLYGKPASQKLREILPRMFLHASRLEFQLPDGTWLDVNSELPAELMRVLQILNSKSHTNPNDQKPKISRSF